MKHLKAPPEIRHKVSNQINIKGAQGNFLAFPYYIKIPTSNQNNLIHLLILNTVFYLNKNHIYEKPFTC